MNISCKGKCTLCTVLLIGTVSLMGCGISTTQNTVINHSTTPPSNSSKSTEAKTAIISEANSDAANVPIRYYEMVNKKQYDEAIKLLGPQIAFYGSPENRKYLINLENTVIKNFHDISNDPQVNITPIEQTYYSVKIYYADLDITVKDENLVPALTAPQHRMFIVVKVNKDGPWLLDSDEATGARS